METQAPEAARSRPAGGRWLVAMLLAAHGGLLAWMDYRNTPSLDEVGHLPAGVSHWKFGRFELYRVNPPLIRAIATLPVAVAGPEIDWSVTSLRLPARPQWDLGRKWIADHGFQTLWWFAVARWMLIPVCLLGGLACFWWARDLYGWAGGLIALALWCFCPNVLGNGAMITPDVGGAAFGVLAGYGFWRWLERPSWRQALVAGLLLGLAELSKSTWIVLFGLWPALWLVRLATDRGGTWDRRSARAGQMAAILGLGLGLLNLGYGFEGSFQRLDQFRFFSETFAGPATEARPAGAAGNRFAGTWLGALPAPVPRNYLRGIDIQKLDFEKKKWSYLRGEHRFGGWWYWYLYASLVKVPLGMWLLLFLALALALFGPPSSRLSATELAVLAPAFAVFVLVSSQTGFTSYLRYVLPAFPFVFVWIGRVARGFGEGGWALRGTVVAGLTWAVGSSLWVYPHSLSYFNELAGGPTGGHAHLADANIDWGQDLLYFKEWMEEHPEARPMHLACYAFFDPRNIGIDYRPLPAAPVPRTSVGDGSMYGGPWGPLPGWHAVSMHRLRSPDNEFGYLLRLQPVATAGYSIYIYHITAEECDRLRAEMGLPPVGKVN